MSKVNKNAKNNFGVFEETILSGESIALKGWWKAGIECIANYKGNASKYAHDASRFAVGNTEGTIRVQVGVVVRAIKAGYTLAEFSGLGIDHVRETMKGSGQRAVTEKKATPKDRAAKTLAKMSKPERRALFLALQEEFA